MKGVRARMMIMMRTTMTMMMRTKKRMRGKQRSPARPLKRRRYTCLTAGELECAVQLLCHHPNLKSAMAHEEDTQTDVGLGHHAELCR